MSTDAVARTMIAGAQTKLNSLEYSGVYNLSSLRNIRKFSGQMAAGLNYFLDINLIGDSYTAASVRYCEALANKLYAVFGNAGGGWVGFGYPAAGKASVNGNVLSTAYAVTFTGTGWSANYNGATASPDISFAGSSVSGDRIIVAFPANTSTIRLLWGATFNGASAGTARYSFDNGATWTAFTLSGNNIGSLALSSIPTTSFNLIIEVTGTNTCRLCGLYTTNTSTRGVRVNKLGGSGATAQQFASFEDANHRTQMAFLGGADAADVILLGANDQGIGRTKAQFKTDIQAIIASRRNQITTRFGGKDILLIAPPENQRVGNPIAMSEYQEAMRELAVSENCGFINLQAFFGPDKNTYSSTGVCPLFNADLLHPEPDTGGKLISEAVANVILYGSSF